MHWHIRPIDASGSANTTPDGTTTIEVIGEKSITSIRPIVILSSLRVVTLDVGAESIVDGLRHADGGKLGIDTLALHNLRSHPPSST